MSTPSPRKPYPTEVSDEEWAFVAPYLALARTGAEGRMLPRDLPRWEAA